jgi:hypothetical protein
MDGLRTRIRHPDVLAWVMTASSFAVVGMVYDRRIPVRLVSWEVFANARVAVAFIIEAWFHGYAWSFEGL